MISLHNLSYTKYRWGSQGWRLYWVAWARREESLVLGVTSFQRDARWAKDVPGERMKDIADRVRQVLADHAQLGVDTAKLGADADLYDAGLTSRASVNVMLALESEFDVEFPDSMLRRDVFESVAAISEAITELTKAGG